METVLVLRLQWFDSKKLRVDAIGVNQDVVPDNLKSFWGDTQFITASEFKNQDHVAITVDCADVKRIGKAMNELFPNIFLTVDHHISNKKYAEHNIVIGTASATTEILTGLALDLELAIDAVSAQALYLGRDRYRTVLL